MSFSDAILWYCQHDISDLNIQRKRLKPYYGILSARQVQHRKTLFAPEKLHTNGFIQLDNFIYYRIQFMSRK